MIDTGLHNKVVVVTGANNPHGIGAAVAKAFVRQKAQVFLHYFRDRRPTQERSESTGSPGMGFYQAQQAKNADEVLQNICDIGGQAHAWESDLSEVTTIQTLFDEAEKNLRSRLCIGEQCGVLGGRYLCPDKR